MYRKEADKLGSKYIQSRMTAETSTSMREPAGMPELLAPAGGIEAFFAAVEKGADAVYGGLEMFNARSSAANFSVGELADAVRYAHLRGVKVYLTLNTLVNQNELAAAVRTAEDAAKCGVDAVIVQDMGLAAAVAQTIPGLPLHASTQMTVYNKEGAEAMRRLGFSRVILAREVTLEDIRDICANVDIEVETFVHGAVCISYSGQCLMSSLLLGRSGNRGRCAQMCRLPWSMERTANPKKYALSPRDLCLANRLRELARAGVSCIKIEGRMKTPEYVGAVTEVYRKILDRGGIAPISEQDNQQLMKAFNRNGFTHLYCDVTSKEQKPGIDMMSADKPKNWGIPIGTVTGGKTFKDRLTGKSIYLAEVRLTYGLALGDGIEFRASAAGDDLGGVVSEIICGGNHIKEAGRGMTVLVGRFSGRTEPGIRVYKTSDIRQNERILRETGKHLRKAAITGRFTADGAGNAMLSAACRGITVSDTAAVFERVGDSGITDETGNCTTMLEKTEYAELIKSRTDSQLRKTGNTPFEFAELVIEVDELPADMKMSAAAVNALRRSVLDALERSVWEQESHKYIINSDINIETVPAGTGRCASDYRTCVYIDGDISQYAADKKSELILPIRRAFDGTGNKLADGGIKIRYRLPAISKGSTDRRLRDRLSELKKALSHLNCEGIVCGNIGQAYLTELCHRLGKTAAADYNMNICNFEAAKKYFELGFDTVMPSIEAESDTDFVEALCARYPGRTELRGSGRAVLMTSDYCPVGAEIGGKTLRKKCSGACAGKKHYLADGRGRRVEIKCDPADCRVRIISETAIKNKSTANGVPFGCAAVITENYD